MKINLDDIYFLENYQTLLIVNNCIYLSQKKYFSVDHFKIEKHSDKNLKEIKIEKILSVNFNDFSTEVEIETGMNSFKLTFFSNEMMLKFVYKIEPNLILKETEKKLTSTQRMIPTIFIFIIILIISFLFGVSQNLILLISLIFVIYKTYKLYGNSKNVKYTKPK
jgi:hypothetical protein